MVDGPDPVEFASRVERSLREGVELEGEIAKAGAEIRERSKSAYGHVLLDARLQLIGLATEVIKLRAGEAGRTDEALSERLALVVGALQGAGVIESLISEGQYLKAAAALRQDLELLARLRELEEGVAKAGKVANMKSLPSGSGRLYGYLSGIAHVSQPEVINGLLGRAQVSDEAFGVAVIPRFAADNAVGLYEIHVWQLTELVRELMRLHIALYGEDDSVVEIGERWASVMVQLEQAGHIKDAAAEAHTEGRGGHSA
jgi:hypothetical protein